MQRVIDRKLHSAALHGSAVGRQPAKGTGLRVDLRKLLRTTGAGAQVLDKLDRGRVLAKASPPAISDAHGEPHEAAGLIKSLHQRGGVPLAMPHRLAKTLMAPVGPGGKDDTEQ